MKFEATKCPIYINEVWSYKISNLNEEVIRFNFNFAGPFMGREYAWFDDLCVWFNILSTQIDVCRVYSGLGKFNELGNPIQANWFCYEFFLCLSWTQPNQLNPDLISL